MMKGKIVIAVFGAMFLSAAAAFAQDADDEGFAGGGAPVPEAEEEAVAAAAPAPAAAAVPAPAPAVAASNEDTGFGFTLESAIDVFGMRSFNGDYAVKAVQNETTNDRVYFYQGEGTTNVFTPTGARGTTAWDDKMLGVATFKYLGQRLGASMQLKGLYIKEVYNNVAQDRLSTAIGDWQAWTKFIFGDTGSLRLLFGNNAQRGAVARFAVFDDFFKTKTENFGIMVPVWARTAEKINGDVLDASPFPYGYESSGGKTKGYADFIATDANDLFMPPGLAVSSVLGASSRSLVNFLIDGTVNVPFPITASFATSGLLSQIGYPFDTPWYAEDKAGIPSIDHGVYDNLEYKDIQLGGRIEAAKIADLVSAAGVFKFLQNTTRKLSAIAGAKDEINEVVSDFAGGLYLNFDLAQSVPGLGFAAGYSLYLRKWTNSYATGDTGLPTKDTKSELRHWDSYYLETYHPFYNGVTFQAQYKLQNIPLTFTLNNNFSFSKQNGMPLDPDGNPGVLKYGGYKVIGWAYADELNEQGALVHTRSESYLGIANTLAATYDIAPFLNVTLQLGNQMGSFSLDWGDDTKAEDGSERQKVSSLTDEFGVYAGTSVTVIEKQRFKATLRGGLDIKLRSYSTQLSDTPDTTYKAGYMDLAFPLGLKVEF